MPKTSSFSAGGKSRIDPSGPGKSDGKGQPVKGGWTHEHCAICWETISPTKQPEGCLTGEDTWVCVACYEKYVVPKSLDFMGMYKDQ